MQVMGNSLKYPNDDKQGSLVIRVLPAASAVELIRHSQLFLCNCKMAPLTYC